MTRDVALYGLRQQCGDYSLRLVAVTGEEFSNEVDVVFNTCDNSTETRGEDGEGEGDVTLDYPLDEEEDVTCVAPVTECEKLEPRQARESASGRAGAPTGMSLIQICAVMIFSKISIVMILF